MDDDQVQSLPLSPATPLLAGDRDVPDRIALLTSFSTSNKSNRSNLSMSSLDCQSDFGNMDIDDNASVNDENKATDSIIRPVGTSITPFTYPRSLSADPMQQPSRMKRKLEERVIKDDIDIHRTSNILIEPSDEACRAPPNFPITPPSSPTSPVRKTLKAYANQLFQSQDIDFNVPRGTMRWIKVDEEDSRLVLCLPKNFNCATSTTSSNVAREEPAVSSPHSPLHSVLRLVDADFGLCLKAGVLRAYLDESLDLIDSTTTSYNNSYTVLRRELKGEEPVSMSLYIVRMLNAPAVRTSEPSEVQYALPNGFNWITTALQLAPTLSVRIALRCRPDQADSFTAKVVQDRPVYSFFEYDLASKKVLRDDLLRPIYQAPAKCRAVLALEDNSTKQTKLFLDCLSDAYTGAMTLSQRLQKGALLRINTLGEVYKARHFLVNNNNSSAVDVTSTAVCELQSTHLCLKMARLSSKPLVESASLSVNSPSSASSSTSSSGWCLSSLEAHIRDPRVSENLPHDLRVMRFFEENVPTSGFLAQEQCGLVACNGHSFFSATVFRPYGSLFDRFLRRQVFNEPICRHIVSFVLQKLNAMHCAGLSHFDVFLDNLILDNNNSNNNSDDVNVDNILTVSSPLLLMDFGQSRVLTFDVLQQRFRRLSHLTQGVGKFVAFAPETCKDLFAHDAEVSSWVETEGVDAEKVDVWQVGVLLFMLLSGRRPFEDPGPKMMQPQRLALLRYWFGLCSDHDRLLTYLQQLRPQTDLRSVFTSEVLDLLCALLTPNPRLRPTVEQVLQHSWLNNLDAPFITRSFSPTNT